MKTTAFTKYHIANGARMETFAGYNMPIEFTGINDEHLTVRNGVGVFDVSHMGEIWVKGPNALAFVQYVSTNDASVLTEGKVQYSCFPNGKGGIVDDFLLYCINNETYLLVVNAANIQKDWDYLCSHAEKFNITPGKELYNASDEICQLAVQGPLAIKAMQKLTSTNIEEMEYYTFKKIDFAGIPEVIFSITGYTGSGGCEIYCANEDADKLWKAVFEAGEEFGIKSIGLAARDTLRLEMGFCLYGHEIDDTSSPIEAGLGWITKFTDANNFIDKELFLKQKTEGVTRKLAGFTMIDRGIPRQHYEVCDAQGNKIGEVCSGTMSPCLKKGIGTAYVKPEFAKSGNEIYIKIREKLIKAETSKLPFYKK